MTPRRKIHGYAEIALPVPVDGTFTYIIPDEIKEEIAPGCRVMVPFGRRRMTGYVISTHSDTPEGFKLKKISVQSCLMVCIYDICKVNNMVQWFVWYRRLDSKR